MKRYISILIEGICFGIVFTIFITLRDKLNLNISEKEIILWSLVIWVAVSVIVRTIMDKINIKKVENQAHINRS